MQGKFLLIQSQLIDQNQFVAALETVNKGLAREVGYHNVAVVFISDCFFQAPDVCRRYHS